MLISEEEKTKTETYTEYECLCDFCGKLYKTFWVQPHKLRTLCGRCDDIFYSNWGTVDQRKRNKKILERIQDYLYNEKASFEIKQLFEEDENEREKM